MEELTRIWKHAYRNAAEYRILEYWSDGRVREVSADQPVYAEWLAAGNVPETISGDEFVTIVDGQPVVNPGKDQIIADRKWDEIRELRNWKLKECDWTQIPDATLTDAEVAAWGSYRQTLRDLPQIYADPDSVVWPPAPGE